MNSTIYTIGHSNLQPEDFIALLRQHNITALADVRSQPYSRFVPHFSRQPLADTLSGAGIAYVFLGKELGARSSNPQCYRNGKVQYDLLAQEPIFELGINRLLRGMEQHRIALMCAEKDPIDCHRALLVSRRLHNLDVAVRHIHSDGTTEDHEAFETRLLARCKLPSGDLLGSRSEYVAQAYSIQSERSAYFDEAMVDSEKVVSRSNEV